jgi:ABC-type cobalt transport system substrate-binding protein
MTALDDAIALIQKQQAAQTEALARLVEGRWTGADGAAGKVVELMGPDAIQKRGFNPIQPPKD